MHPGVFGGHDRRAALAKQRIGEVGPHLRGFRLAALEKKPEPHRTQYRTAGPDALCGRTRAKYAPAGPLSDR
jgi:hypothetical protein